MCNRLHSNSKKIDKTGYAWKVVRLGYIERGIGKGKFIMIPGVRGKFTIKNKRGYVMDGRWIKWENPSVGDGFCLISEKKDALRLSKIIPQSIVVYVQYRRGLGEFIEYETE